MPLIETEEAARRLARAIASDLSLYNEEKIINGITNDNLFQGSVRGDRGRPRAVQAPRRAGALSPQLLRPRAGRHPHQGQGAHQVEDLVSETAW